MDYDLLIAGGGPAGLTAGIYAARGGLKTAIVGGLYKGGKTALVKRIENYSGVVDADGFLLTAAMGEQAQRSGVEFIDAVISSFRLDEVPKKLITEEGKELTSRFIILAMGTHNKNLGLPNEEKLTGQGVSYCSGCDGAFFRGKVVAVCGGGNSALTEALYLAKVASKVYLIHKRDKFKAAAVLVNRANEQSNIVTVMESAVQELHGEPLDGITIKNLKSGDLSKLDIKGLFVAVGSLANTDAVKGQVALDEKGYIITDAAMATNVENVYAAGDIRTTPLRQIITACADGAIAADSIVRMSH